MNEQEMLSPVPETEAHRTLREGAPFYLLLAAAAGLAFSLLFAHAEMYGLNILLFTLVWCGALHFSLRRLGLENLRATGIWYISALLLALSVFLTANEFVQMVSILGLVLTQLFLLLRTGTTLRDWHFSKAVGAVWRLFWHAVGRIAEPFRHMAALRKNDTHKRARYVVIGLLIAVPLAALVLTLLSHSDAVFSALLRRLFGSADLGELLEKILVRVLLFFLAFWAFYGLLCAQTAKPESEGQKDVRRADTLIAVTFTAVLAVIYAVFCAIQVWAFFGKAANALPEGYSYAQYAREGFFELLAVSAVNVLLVIVSQRRFTTSRALRILLCFLSLCTYIMEASSVWRMLLYVQVYGFTFWRLLALWFLLLMAILLGGTVYTVFHPDFRLFSFALWLTLALWLVFAFAKPDTIAVRYDLDRFGVTDNVLECALYDLSLDVIPSVAASDLPKDGSLPGIWRDYLTHGRIHQRYREAGVTGFNLSLWQAKRSAEVFTAEVVTNGR